jgi:hypothetical protein
VKSRECITKFQNTFEVQWGPLFLAIHFQKSPIIPKSISQSSPAPTKILSNPLHRQPTVPNIHRKKEKKTKKKNIVYNHFIIKSSIFNFVWPLDMVWEELAEKKQTNIREKYLPDTCH